MTFCSEIRREGQLHDESVHVLVFVELVHFGQKFLFADSILEAEQGRFKTAGFASQNLVAHVSLAASVMSHEDGSQMRAFPSAFYDLFYLFGNFRLDLCGGGLSVNQLHGYSSFGLRL